MPGSVWPESLRPASRLKALSARSPAWPTTAVSAPPIAPSQIGMWSAASGSDAERWARPAPTSVAVTTPPARPSQDFFGESQGIILCLPIAMPVK